MNSFGHLLQDGSQYLDAEAGTGRDLERTALEDKGRREVLNEVAVRRGDVARQR